MIASTLTDPLIANASGSVGDTVFGRNQHGPWTRDRVTPTDPATAPQLELRDAMRTVTEAWRVQLTPAERLSWELYASNVFLRGRLGRHNFIHGLPHFARSNIPRLQIDPSPAGLILTAPKLFDLGPYTSITRAVFNVIDNALLVFFNPADTWAAETRSATMLYVSPVQISTIRFYKGPYTFSHIIEGDPASIPASPAAFAAPPGATVDNHFFIRGRVTRADGRLTPAFRLDVSADPQVPAEPISLENVGTAPIRYDVGFTDQIAVEFHRPGQWSLRADGTTFTVTAVDTVAGKIRLTVTLIGATPMRDRVIYFPAIPDVRGVSTSILVPDFTFFP